MGQRGGVVSQQMLGLVRECRQYMPLGWQLLRDWSSDERRVSDAVGRVRPVVFHLCHSPYHLDGTRYTTLALPSIGPQQLA